MALSMPVKDALCHNTGINNCLPGVLYGGLQHSPERKKKHQLCISFRPSCRVSHWRISLHVPGSLWHTGLSVFQLPNKTLSASLSAFSSCDLITATSLINEESREAKGKSDFRNESPCCYSQGDFIKKKKKKNSAVWQTGHHLHNCVHCASILRLGTGCVTEST